MAEASFLTQQLRVLCQEIVESCLPEEAPFFDVVWSAFWNYAGCESIENLPSSPLLPRKGSEPILAHGAIGTERDQILDAFRVVGTLCLAAADAFQQSSGSLASTEKLKKKVQLIAVDLGTPKHLIKELDLFVERLNHMLLTVDRSRSRDGGQVSPSSNRSDLPKGEKAWVYLLKGGLRSDFEYSSKRVEDERKRCGIDLFVDELGWEIWTRYRDNPINIPKLPLGQRYLIWHALTQVGRPPISRGDLLDNLPSIVQSQLYEGNFHQVVGRLGANLKGDLREKMLDTTVRNKLFVSLNDWSYCWIRVTSEKSSCRLLWDVQGSEKNS